MSRHSRLFLCSLLTSIPRGIAAPSLSPREAPTDVYRDQPSPSVAHPLVQFLKMTPNEAFFPFFSFLSPSIKTVCENYFCIQAKDEKVSSLYSPMFRHRGIKRENFSEEDLCKRAEN